MREIPNLWFKVGSGLVAVIFIALNFLSYMKESSKYLDSLNGRIRFSGGGYWWGFPFKMYANLLGNPNYIGFEPVATSINIIIFFACAGGFGIFLEFVASKLGRERLPD